MRNPSKDIAVDVLGGKIRRLCGEVLSGVASPRPFQQVSTTLGIPANFMSLLTACD
jgi:hypothetical protein